MTIKVIGIDIAKSVFQIHGVDEHGKTVSIEVVGKNWTAG
jgi:hypothetical protein